jgi:hypothetical protein
VSRKSHKRCGPGCRASLRTTSKAAPLLEVCGRLSPSAAQRAFADRRDAEPAPRFVRHGRGTAATDNPDRSPDTQVRSPDRRMKGHRKAPTSRASSSQVTSDRVWQPSQSEGIVGEAQGIVPRCIEKVPPRATSRRTCLGAARECRTTQITRTSRDKGRRSFR